MRVVPRGTLSIAAYGFLMAHRLKAGGAAGGKKNFMQCQVPAIPEDYIPRGSPARATSRGGLDHDDTPDPSVALAGAMGHCPHCKWVSRRLTL
jgi:hypothetical protein